MKKENKKWRKVCDEILNRFSHSGVKAGPPVEQIASKKALVIIWHTCTILHGGDERKKRIIEQNCDVQQTANRKAVFG